MRIRIAKWYLDCVSENGNLFMGYAASLSLGFFPVHLVSRVLLLDENVRSLTRSAWTSQSPKFTDAGLLWSCRRLQLRGHWSPRMPSASRRLFRNSMGSVQWDCTQPLSDAEVFLNGDCICSGLGYAETLTMDISPAEIGLRRLYWGRFLSQDTSIVWIQWEGKEPQLVVLFNGADKNNSELASNRLDIGDRHRLQWTDSRPIRTGPLRTSILGSLPWLNKILPAWMGNIVEHKWRSRGSLFMGDDLMAEGWIIHEEVVFNHRVQI